MRWTVIGVLVLTMTWLLGFGRVVHAQDCLMGEVRLFAGNFAPRGWALAQGQLLSIAQYQAVFSILGTQYGGDGRTTFGLPDLRGRFSVGAGNGPGLTTRSIGSKGGQETVRLGAAGNVSLTRSPSSGKTTTVPSLEPHINMPPFQALNYIICLQGIYPSRN